MAKYILLTISACSSYECDSECSSTRRIYFCYDDDNEEDGGVSKEGKEAKI